MRRATTIERGPYRSYLRCACGRLDPELSFCGPFLLDPRMRGVCPSCGQAAALLERVAMREVIEVSRGWFGERRRLLKLEAATS